MENTTQDWRNKMPSSHGRAIPIVAPLPVERRRIMVLIGSRGPAVGFLTPESPEDVVRRLREAVGEAWCGNGLAPEAEDDD